MSLLALVVEEVGSKKGHLSSALESGTPRSWAEGETPMRLIKQTGVHTPVRRSQSS